MAVHPFPPRSTLHDYFTWWHCDGTLDDKLQADIAAAFRDGARSADIEALIKVVDTESLLANERAERARQNALDPSIVDVTEARARVGDLVFKAGRLRTAAEKLKECGGARPPGRRA